MESIPMEKFIKISVVMAATGLGRSSIYEMISAGKFPRSVKLSEKSVAWVASEIEEWQRIKIAARDTEQKS